MDYFAFSALFNFVVSSLLGVFVLYKNTRARVNRSLFFLCSTAAWWSGFYFLWQTTNSTGAALIWTKLLMLGAIWIPYTYIKVIFIFLENEHRHKILLRLVYIMSLILSALIPTSLIVSHISPVYGFLLWPKPGPAYIPFLSVFIMMILYGMHVSYQESKSLPYDKKKQLKIILVGMAVSLIAGSTNYFLWYDIPIKPYGNILASVYVVTMVYAIIRHQVMDIKLTLRGWSVYVTSLSSIVLFALVIQHMVHLVFPLVDEFWLSFALITASVSVHPIVKRHAYRVANKYFFSSLYDSNEVIAKLSNKLLSVLEIGRLYQTINSTITETFHTKSVSILTFDKKTGEFAVSFNNGFDIYNEERGFINAVLTSIPLRHNECVIVENIRASAQASGKDKKLLNLLNKYGVEIMVPLNIKDDLIGIIVLGPKESKDSYNKEDIQVLEVIRAQTSIALENALLYAETLQSERQLEQKVKSRTRDLQQKSDELVAANKRLKQLDAAKTEFLSIASHQLRTPLSGIKGYVSMMNDGDFGAFKPGQKEILMRVGTEVDRLVRLVQVFLDVSRIESGRLNISKKEFNFVDLVKETVEELKPTADSKKIKLTHKGRKKTILIEADRDKLKDVLVNLIDNAVKYTPKGSVWTEIEDSDSSVKFQVRDSGVGMEPDEVSRVFEKFARGKGIDRISTSGSGLGLFIAKKIVESHKGKIWAESEGKGKGSVFVFEIPKR